MATYGYSTPYTGQRQPTLPPGYMEAATAPGRNIAAGIQQFAAGLGQTIQRYQANKAETEAATQTFETLSGMASQALTSDPQYQALQQYYETGQLPAGVTQNDLRRFETKVQADRSMLNKMAGIGEKFGDMSLAKKKAAIGDMAMVLGQYQNRATEDLKRRQLELTVSEAERALKTEQDIADLTRYAAGLPSTKTVQEQVPVELQPIGPMPAAQIAAPIPVSAGGTGEWPAGLPPISTGPVRRQYAPTQPSQGLMSTGIPVGGAMQFAQKSPSQMGRVTPQAPTQIQTPAPSPTEIGLPPAVTVQEQVQRTEQIPYSETRRNLAQYAASMNMSPKAFQALDKVMEVAGMQKPLQVEQMTTPEGISVIRADGKIDIIPPVRQPNQQPSEADKAFVMNINGYLSAAQELKDTIDKYGTFEAISPTGAANLNSIPYQLAIMYAKIMDPGSVAREGEVEAAKKYLIPLGVTARKSVALASINRQIEEMKKKAALYQQMTGRPAILSQEKTDQVNAASGQFRLIRGQGIKPVQ